MSTIRSLYILGASTRHRTAPVEVDGAQIWEMSGVSASEYAGRQPSSGRDSLAVMKQANAWGRESAARERDRMSFKVVTTRRMQS
nr:hypothetical protein CFP56_70493 [Quercus suber]